MTLFTRLVAVAAIVSLTCLDAVAAVDSGASVHYRQAHRRVASGQRVHPAARAQALDDSALMKRSIEKRCNAKTTSSSTTSHKPTSTTSHKAAATSPASASHDSGNGGSPPSGKKGLAWSSSGDYLKNFVNKSVKVMYTWGATCPSQASELGVDCASMLWGTKNIAAFKSAASSHKYLMGPNEANLGSQANLSVGELVKLWNEYVRPYYGNDHYLVAPSVASSSNALSYLQSFFKECGSGPGDNCGVSALSLHYYGTKSSDLINYVTKMHEGLNNLDVWLTEFSCENFGSSGGQCSSSMATQFLEEVVEWAEKTSWVKFYSPYGFTSNMEDQAGAVSNVNALMTSAGTPTSNGKWYLNYDDN